MEKFITHKMVDIKPWDIFNISLASSNCKNKEVFIFERWNLNDLITNNEAEIVRKNFLENNVKIKQITNNPVLSQFTENTQFLNKLISFRYVPKDIFDIENEILIFGNIVAIYNSKKIIIIEDKIIADNYIQLFLNIWDQWNSPTLNFDYKPNHSFYKNLNYFIGDLQIIVWADSDAIDSYKWYNKETLWEYICDLIKKDSYFDDSSYIITFIWSLNWEKMIDIWKFTQNHVDDRSWPLWDIRVYREWKICNNLWLASWNTLLVLSYEEKLRRQSRDLKSYLGWPVPKLPLEIMNWKDFFKIK